MKCHDVQRMISGFIEEKLTDEQLEGFLEHIENCQDCYDELEVYYMITIGLMQLDEDHTGTMDLKKNLKDFISEQNKELYMRKRLAARRLCQAGRHCYHSSDSSHSAVIRCCSVGRRSIH